MSLHAMLPLTSFFSGSDFFSSRRIKVQCVTSKEHRVPGNLESQTLGFSSLKLHLLHAQALLESDAKKIYKYSCRHQGEHCATTFFSYYCKKNIYKIGLANLNFLPKKFFFSLDSRRGSRTFSSAEGAGDPQKLGSRSYRQFLMIHKPFIKMLNLCFHLAKKIWNAAKKNSYSLTLSVTV